MSASAFADTAGEGVSFAVGEDGRRLQGEQPGGRAGPEGVGKSELTTLARPPAP